MSNRLHDVYEYGVRPFLAPPGRGTPLPALPHRLREFRNVYSITIESRLGRADGAVDFAWSQDREELEIPRTLANKEPWSAIGHFLDRWSRDEGALPAVPSIVWEIDQDGDCFGEIPAIFFNRIKGNSASVSAIYRLTSEILSRAPSTATEVMLRRVVDRMPPESIVLCIGYMLSRPDAPLRFELTEIDRQRSLPDYLEAIGWPGDIKRVETVLNRLPNMNRDFDLGLAFDVGETVGPRLGLEFVFRNYSDREAALSGALDDLIAAGLCAPGWREALARWTGGGAPQADWFMALVSTPREHHRFVSHFKIVLDGPQVEAKGYVECIPLSMLAPAQARRSAVVPA